MSTRIEGKASSEGVTLSSLSEAKSALAGMGDSYEKHVLHDINRLQIATDALKSEIENQGKRNDVFLIGHNIAGLGDTFNYDLVTVIGCNLCRFLERPQALGDAGLEIIQSHIKALKTVIENKMKGDAHPDGCQLVEPLKKMTSREIE